MGTDVDKALKDLRDDLGDVKKTVGEIAKKGDDIAAALSSLCKDASSNAKAADGAVGSVAKVVASIEDDVGKIRDANSENATHVADSERFVKELMQIVESCQRKHDVRIAACQQAILHEVVESGQRLIALLKQD